MTEAEWWAARRYVELARWLRAEAKPAARKSRLFALACCRAVQRYLADWPCEIYVDLAEQLADGHVTAEDVPEAIDSISMGWGSSAGSVRTFRTPLDRADATLRRAFFGTPGGDGEPLMAPQDASSALRGTHFACEEAFIPYLHDIFGPLPFRDVAVAPAWLTSDVLALARAVYDEKAFDRMPILADALQDAGCDNDEILEHCRAEKWGHVRGCWVIDLVLGKPWREPATTA